MQVYLLRHGIAEKDRVGLSDADRALTDLGRRKLRQVMKAGAEAQVEPSLVLCSPLKRAIETAEIAATVLGYKKEILRTKALLPGARPEQAWDEIRVHKDEHSLLLVGHNPQFTYLSGYLLGSSDVQIEFKKGALMRVDFDTFRPSPRGVLRWYLTSKLADGKKD